MPDLSEWERAVQRLTEQTERGVVSWIITHGVERRDSEGSIYRAGVQGKSILCYKYHYPEYEGATEDEWISGVIVEFIDSENETEWRWPETSSHERLLDAIHYRQSGAGGFLNRFLADEKP